MSDTSSISTSVENGPESDASTSTPDQHFNHHHIDVSSSDVSTISTISITMDPTYPLPPTSPSYDIEIPLPWWSIEDFEDRPIAFLDECETHCPDQYEMLDMCTRPSSSAEKARSMIPRTVKDFRYTQSDDGEIESIYYGPGLDSIPMYRYAARASEFADIFSDSSSSDTNTPNPKRSRSDTQDDTTEDDRKPAATYNNATFNRNLHHWLEGTNSTTVNESTQFRSTTDESNSTNINHSGSRANPQNQRSDSSRPNSDVKPPPSTSHSDRRKE